MKSMLSSFCSVGLLITLASGGSLAAGEDPSTKERLGPLALGQKQAAVIKVLGEPKAKGKDIEWEALGEHVQEWRYPAKGLTLNMASIKEGGAKTVLSISADSNCSLATSREITIGSSEAEVRRAYGKLEDKEASEAGKIFVAGSVYGGVIFHFTKGTVSGIFIGAAAE